MSDLQTILSNPIAWLDWDQDEGLLAFLSDLQANILKGHGRDHTVNMFFSFADMPPEEIKALLHNLSFLVTPALEQLRSAAAFKLTGVSGGRIVCVMLGRGAYEKIGVPVDQQPADAAFQSGMRAQGELRELQFQIGPNTFSVPGINDPARENWEAQGPWAPGKNEPDLVVLVADDDPALVTRHVTNIQEKLLNGTGAILLGEDRGLAQRRRQNGETEKGEGLEHFGYVDGRSQPLFLAEDIQKEEGGILAEGKEVKWSAAFPPAQFIVPDPAECTPVSAGSYFVYRKLEQNVAKFKEQEITLAETFAHPISHEKAGALVVGRFEDGTPIATSSIPTGGDPLNNFNYDGQDDPDKAQCPFKAHVRKTNPRTVDDNANERSRLMARRGITYGERKPRAPGTDFPDDDRPTKDVGLLFMAYMANIHEQFEFTQAAWAGNLDFQLDDTGIDPVIGQQKNTNANHTKWHDSTSGQDADFDFLTSIRLVGGGYFFAPSISFLQRFDG